MRPNTTHDAAYKQYGPLVIPLMVAAKAAGQTVAAEVDPWCFWLHNDCATIERLGSHALSYCVQPHHSKAVYEAFKEGTVDIMATDHAQQFYLSLLMTDVAAGKLSLERVADATATRPTRIFGLYPRKRALAVGSDADIVLVDPAKKHTIGDEEVLSKCGWTPYARPQEALRAEAVAA